MAWFCFGNSSLRDRASEAAEQLGQERTAEGVIFSRRKCSSFNQLEQLVSSVFVMQTACNEHGFVSQKRLW